VTDDLVDKLLTDTPKVKEHADTPKATPKGKDKDHKHKLGKPKGTPKAEK
jgi:hypothetical protein